MVLDSGEIDPGAGLLKEEVEVGRSIRALDFAGIIVRAVRLAVSQVLLRAIRGRKAGTRHIVRVARCQCPKRWP
jgi:hypothetical protein